MNQSTDNPAAVPNDGHDWVVMKFGGTSVSTADRWQTIRDLIGARMEAGLRPLIVHSAIAGMSNRLEAALSAAAQGDPETLRDEIADGHRRLATDLGLNADELLAADLAELDQLLAGIRLVREASPRVQARVMALGELMATRLGAAYLRACGLDVEWVDARELLVSEDLDENETSRYLAASCDFSPDPGFQATLASRPAVLITQGFIARNREGEGVLLGRGGSDTSAAYLAARLQARRLEVWTDVPGMFSADPRVVPGARLLRRLSYEEAQEIASTGGSVLHPRCIRPVRRYGIPLHVLSTSRPDMEGTQIGELPGGDAPRLTALASRRNITVVSMETVGMWHEVGFLAEAFRCFSDLGLSVDLVSTAESNVTVTLDTAQQRLDERTLARLRTRLERLCRVHIITDAEVVSLVGRKIRGILHEIGPALEAFEERRIHLVSQAASDLNLSFVVEEGQSHRLVQQLHDTLVHGGPDDELFGPSWQSLQQPAEPATPALPDSWWRRRRAELLEIAAGSPSAYVYELDSVRAACQRLTGLGNVADAFFAIKANSNAEVLRTVGEAGVNFECVSPGEIARVLSVFPDLDRRRILFTPNFAPRMEYAQALETGAWVTLDNLHPLRHWGDVFDGREILLRLDTGQGRGHHEHVRTAGAQSKFGIPLFELDEARELAAAAGARVVGLHAHTGSGILQADNWEDVATTLAELAGEFPDVRILDVGGGLGVPEKPGEQPLDMAALDASLAALRARLPQYHLWLEPGRYVAAEAGVLLATVTQVKGKGDVQYVGVSTGMNSLIRPALYGAYHEIVNLTRLGEPASQMVNVVGPNCETGDRLGNDRLLPPCEEGDVLLIANAGAYGYVMSSRYNLREPATEFVI
jgi:diaminopimelate decarboxylase/aspartate kinase